MTTIKILKANVRHRSPIIDTFTELEKLFGEFEVMISGGSVRKAFFNLPLDNSDFDLFFRSKEQFDAAKSVLHKYGITPSVHENCDSFTLTRDMKLPINVPKDGIYVQLIKKDMCDDVNQLMSRYDFTVCQFAYDRGTFYFTPQAVADSASYTLRINEHRETNEISASRLIKYIRIGFEPTIELFEAFFIQGRDTYTKKSCELSGYADLYGSI